MPSVSDWKVPASAQPKAADYAYDLDAALAAVVGVRAIVPPDAFTADTLGTERAGNGVLIGSNGLVLTIGYLVTEAETIWLLLIDGRAVPATVLAYDQTTGFGLVQALARLDLPALPLGNSGAVAVGERVVVGGAGGRQRSVAARIVAKQEFAGYWEYVVDEAIFTAPSHPNWGGTALIGPAGDLHRHRLAAIAGGPRAGPAGRPQHDRADRPAEADLQRPAHHRPAQQAAAAMARPLCHRSRRPIVVVGPRQGRPRRKGRHPHRRRAAVGRGHGDHAASPVCIARSGRSAPAGVDVPFSIYRDGKTIEAQVKTGDRNRFLKAPKLH